MRLRTLAIAASIMTLAASSAQASFIWNGPGGTPAAGAVVEFKLQNFEVILDKSLLSDPTYVPGALPTTAQILAHKQSGGVVDDVGDQAFGIFRITSIEPLGGGAAHWQASPTQNLEGVFYGIEAVGIIPPAGPTATFLFAGGKVDLYFDGSTDFAADPGPFRAGWAGIAASNGVGNAGDSLILSADFVAGVVGSPAVTVSSTFTAFSGGPPPKLTGVSDGFLDITFSSVFLFVTDAFDAGKVAGSEPPAVQQDATFKSNFETHTVFNNPYEGPDVSGDSLPTGWTLHSQDPIRIQIVPEPGSLAIWALVLFGLIPVVRMARRRQG